MFRDDVPVRSSVVGIIFTRVIGPKVHEALVFGTSTMDPMFPKIGVDLTPPNHPF